MRLATIKIKGVETAAIVQDEQVITLASINQQLNTNWLTDILSILQHDQLDSLNAWYQAEGKEKLKELASEAIALQDAKFGPLYHHPRKIFGIGLNYCDHAADLAEKAPSGIPASFLQTRYCGYRSLAIPSKFLCNPMAQLPKQNLALSSVRNVLMLNRRTGSVSSLDSPRLST